MRWVMVEAIPPAFHHHDGAQPAALQRRSNVRLGQWGDVPAVELVNVPRVPFIGGIAEELQQVPGLARGNRFAAACMVQQRGQQAVGVQHCPDDAVVQDVAAAGFGPPDTGLSAPDGFGRGQRGDAAALMRCGVEQELAAALPTERCTRGSG